MNDPGIDKMKPCPFCGSESIVALRNEKGKCWAACAECGAAGPPAFTQSKANANWHLRAQVLPPALPLLRGADLPEIKRQACYSAAAPAPFPGYQVWQLAGDARPKHGSAFAPAKGIVGKLEEAVGFTVQLDAARQRGRMEERAACIAAIRQRARMDYQAHYGGSLSGAAIRMQEAFACEEVLLALNSAKPIA